MDHLDRLIGLALDEDLASSGDVTTQACVDVNIRAEGQVRAKENLVLSGVQVFARVMRRVDPAIELDILGQDGADVTKDTVVIRARGRARSLLIAERPALNFIMRLSGIATQSRSIANAVRGTNARVVDTRKTTPGWRAIEKQAVRDGGCASHRTGLFDGVLIKDNHIEAAGGVKHAVERARASVHHLLKIEVEAQTQAQVAECLALDVDGILLDNMDDAQLKTAVDAIRAHEKSSGRKVTIEASGNMTIERLPRVAATGVDVISMGALTHQARSADLSMKIKLLP